MCSFGSYSNEGISRKSFFPTDHRLSFLECSDGPEGCPALSGPWSHLSLRPMVSHSSL